MNLEGRFIKLRSIEEKDAEVTFKWRQIQRANLLNSGATTVEEQRKWIASRSANGSEYNFIIELKSGTPVGMISIVNVNKMNKHGESARFLIGEEELVQGVPVAVEAMSLLYKFAFETLSLERIFGTIVEENKLMIKWQKFFGMKQEGVLRNHYFINGKLQNAVMMGILKSEYETVAIPRMKAMMK